MNGAAITVRDLTIGYGDFLVLRDLTFSVPRGSICFVIGPSGSGKTTLLRHLVGLDEPLRGSICIGREELCGAPPRERRRILDRVGVVFQTGGLLSSMTLGENVALPLGESTALAPGEVRAVVQLKLALVGLRGLEGLYPAQLSGGMQKRAALARAMALDPEVLFLDEPSSGLDPVSARRLDDLIVELRQSLGATVVSVSHDLDSLFAIGDQAFYLDVEQRTITASGPPHELLERTRDPHVRAFLTRGGERSARG
jgi:phospholipid/cholesterol/gamma-HCH transport system ATP-binding protein